MKTFAAQESAELVISKGGSFQDGFEFFFGAPILWAYGHTIWLDFIPAGLP